MQDDYDDWTELLQVFYLKLSQSHSKSTILKHKLFSHLKSIEPQNNSKKINYKRYQRFFHNSPTSPSPTFETRTHSELRLDTLSSYEPENTTIYESSSFIETVTYGYTYRLIEISDSKKMSILCLRIKKLLEASEHSKNKNIFELSFNSWKKIAVMCTIKNETTWTVNLNDLFRTLSNTFKKLLYSSLALGNKLENKTIADPQIDQSFVNKMSDCLNMSIKYLRESNQPIMIQNNSYNHQIEVHFRPKCKNGYLFVQRHKSAINVTDRAQKRILSPRYKQSLKQKSENSYRTYTQLPKKHSQGVISQEQYNIHQTPRNKKRCELSRKTKQIIGMYKNNNYQLSQLYCLKK